MYSYPNFCGYQPQIQPGMYQPPTALQAAQAQPAQTGPVVLQVGCVKDFDSVTLQPGRQALIMAQNDPIIAFKSADQMGMVTTSLYRIEPVSPEQLATPAPDYITRAEFEQTIAALSAKRAPRKEAAE